MSASTKMLPGGVLRQFLRYCIWNNQVRGLKRNPAAVYSAEEEKKLLKRRGIRKSPKKNPYINYELSDPVQKNLVGLEKLKNKPPGLKSDRLVSDLGTTRLIQNMPGKGSIKGPKKSIIPESYEYEQLADSDKRFGKAVVRAKNKRDRVKSREVLLEGRRLVLDALAAGATLKELYFSGADTLDDELLEALSGKPIFKVTYKEMKIWSDTDTPQGIIGIFEMPPENMQPIKDCFPVTLILDQVRDPGNLGTLLRTAAAVGCKKVIAVKGCVDAWSPKVLRSGAGCHYRVPIIADLPWSDVERHISDCAQVFIADNHKPSNKVLEELFGTNEIVDELDRLETEEMYANDNDTDSDTGSESDSNSESETNLHEAKLNETESTQSHDETDLKSESPALKMYKNAPLNTSVYDEVDYVSKHTVIIIGGESQGISLHARKLAYTYYGQCVTVPMMAEVESLNASVAGSIVLYEANKQFRHSKKVKSDLVDDV